MKVASTFQKSQAGIEDFLLAIFRTETENWFYKFLDFIGITPKDFESELVELNTLISGAPCNPLHTSSSCCLREADAA